MKRAPVLALFGAALGMALFGAACMMDSGHGNGGGGWPPGGTGGTGGGTGGSGGGSLCDMPVASAFTFQWGIETPAQQATTCDAVGATQMDVDIVSMTSGAEYHYQFPCNALGGTTCELPLGEYSLAMRLRNRVGDLMSELVWPQTEFTDAAGITDLGAVPFEATPDQYIRLSWSIERQGTLQVLTCAQAGAATVRIDTTAARYDLPCADQHGRTETIPTGSYNVTLSLLNASQTVLSITPSRRVDIPAAQPVDLGTAVFEVQ